MLKSDNRKFLWSRVKMKVKKYKYIYMKSTKLLSLKFAVQITKLKIKLLRLMDYIKNKQNNQ